jgi:UPF0755 protein
MADEITTTPIATPKIKPGFLMRVFIAGIICIFAIGAWFVLGWEKAGPSSADTMVYISSGASVGSAAKQLEKQGVISSASTFRRMARLLGDKKSIKPGEYKFPRHVSMSRVLGLLQSGDVLLRRITITEGMSALQVLERLQADPMLSGEASLPTEGSLLPETYSYTRGEPRQAIIDRAQDSMAKVLADAWAKRASDLPFDTPEDAVTLASIIEKETSKKAELPKVAGVYINRLRIGMKLQADPTIIYPITKGKPLGRRILKSEIAAINEYNTYTRDGLPVGPIAMPGRKAIIAALNPEKTDALFFVADGSGGHVFAKTGAEHERNVVNWRKYRAQNGI